MIHRAFSGLRARLLGLVILAVLPAVGLALVTAAELHNAAAAQIRTTALRFARVTADRQEHALGDARNVLVTLAQLPVVRNRQAAMCSALLADLLPQYSAFANLIVDDADGNLLCSAVPPGGPVNHGDREWFRQVIESRAFTTSGYQVDRITAKPSLAAGYPVYDGTGRMLAVMAGALDLAWLNRLVAEAELPAGSTVTVFDRNGTVLAHHPEPGRWVGQPAGRIPIVRAVLDGRREGIAEAPGLDGARELFGFAPIGRPPGREVAFVAVGVPTNVFASLDSMLTRNLVALTAVLLLAMAAAWAAGSLFVLRPVGAAIEAAQRLSRGDLGARTGLRTEWGEIGVLGRTLDDMATALAARQAEASQRAMEVEALIEAVRRSEERFRLLAEHAPDTIFRYDLRPEPRLNYISPAVEAMLGYRPDELYDCPERLSQTVHADDRASVWTAFSGGSPGQRLVVRLTHRRGALVWGELLPNPVADESGNVVAVEGIVRDITERKQIEERLLRAQRLEVAGRVAAGVAHDLNNLLGPLMWGPELIKRQLPPGHPAAEDCDAMVAAVQRIASINQDLLTLGRRGNADRELVDLRQVIDDALDQMPPLPDTLALDLDLGDEPLVTLAAPAQLFRVVTNLLANARQAMADGGTLTLDAERVNADEQFARDNLVEPGAYVRLAVIDTGPGIDAEIRGKIFDPFFTTKRADQRRGSGLGLSVVQAIVRDHGGCVDVESEPGRGATFRVYLPAARV